MKKLPDEQTLAELLYMAKSFSDSARNLYLMAESFAQKCEHQLKMRVPSDETQSNSPSIQESVS